MTNLDPKMYEFKIEQPTLKYVKGPWRLEENGFGYLGVMSPDPLVGAVTQWDLSICSDERLEQLRATAKLIAAAPELLRELKTVYEGESLSNPTKVSNSAVWRQVAITLGKVLSEDHD